MNQQFTNKVLVYHQPNISNGQFGNNNNQLHFHNNNHNQVMQSVPYNQQFHNNQQYSPPTHQTNFINNNNNFSRIRGSSNTSSLYTPIPIQSTQYNPQIPVQSIQSMQSMQSVPQSVQSFPSVSQTQSQSYTLSPPHCYSNDTIHTNSMLNQQIQPMQSIHIPNISNNTQFEAPYISLSPQINGYIIDTNATSMQQFPPILNNNVIPFGNGFGYSNSNEQIYNNQLSAIGVNSNNINNINNNQVNHPLIQRPRSMMMTTKSNVSNNNNNNNGNYRRISTKSIKSSQSHKHNKYNNNKKKSNKNIKKHKSKSKPIEDQTLSLPTQRIGQIDMNRAISHSSTLIDNDNNTNKDENFSNSVASLIHDLNQCDTNKLSQSEIGFIQQSMDSLKHKLQNKLHNFNNNNNDRSVTFNEDSNIFDDIYTTCDGCGEYTSLFNYCTNEQCPLNSNQDPPSAANNINSFPCIDSDDIKYDDINDFNNQNFVFIDETSDVSLHTSEDEKQQFDTISYYNSNNNDNSSDHNDYLKNKPKLFDNHSKTFIKSKTHNESIETMDINNNNNNINDNSNKISTLSKIMSKKDKDFSKSESTFIMLNDIIIKDQLFNGLTNNEIEKLVSKMFKIKIKPNRCIIKKGEISDAYFIVEKGELLKYSKKNTNKHNKFIRKEKGRLFEGDSFGKQSLLFCKPREYNIKTVKDTIVWALSEYDFNQARREIIVRRNKQKNTKIEFLQNIPIFKNISFDDLKFIADLCKPFQYYNNNYIFRENEASVHFFIVYKGSCESRKRNNSNSNDFNSPQSTESSPLSNVSSMNSMNSDYEMIQKYEKTDYFGYNGIINHQLRTYDMIVTSDICKCYLISASDFIRIMQHTKLKLNLFDNIWNDSNNMVDITDINDIDLQNSKIELKPVLSVANSPIKPKFVASNGKNLLNKKFSNRIKTDLNQYLFIDTLGKGTFGEVSLVEDPNTNLRYSMKKINKNKVKKLSQEIHIINEKMVMASLDNKYCVKLYATYQDNTNFYFMMDAVLGGELYRVLEYNNRFDESASKFYAANVICAIEYLHSKNVIFRDLKPENLLVCSNGYLKLCDFGFAKERNNACTLCGTPDYLAPEMIQCENQSFGVDWWALGILIFEMLIGTPPFKDDINTKMYEKILTQPIQFPDKPRLTPESKHVIVSLLRKNPHRRLGTGLCGAFDIKIHPWFQEINWDLMDLQEISPPYIPKILKRKKSNETDYTKYVSINDDIKNSNEKQGTWYKDF